MNYLNEIKKYDPYYIGCMGGITIYGEEEFISCCDFSCGIGDKTWWIDKELEILTIEKQRKLLFILKRNSWIRDNIIIHEIIKDISKEIGCETHHIYRLGERVCYELIKNRVRRYVRYENFSKLPEVQDITEEHINNIDYNEEYKKFLKTKEKNNYFFNKNDPNDFL